MDPVDLAPDTMRRLALIRLLLSRAEEEAGFAPPFSSDSINRLHDVAEMFLALAAQQHHARIPRNFMDYWEALEPALGRPLTYRAQMEKFNKVRVNLKHYGVEPHPAEVQSAVTVICGLVTDECPALFGVQLDEVSLAEYVRDAEARRLLESAESRWQAADQAEAFADLADAFGRVIRDYTERKQVWARRSVFDTTQDLTFLTPFFRLVDDREQSRFEEAVVESLEALDFRLLIVGLGVDLRRYGKFSSLTPNIFRTMNGKRHVQDREGIRRDQADYEFCRNFVVTTALHLAEFDYDFDHWEEGQVARQEPGVSDEDGEAGGEAAST